MGSGSFPLSRKNGSLLIEAANLIHQVHNDWISDVYSGDSGGSQYDNAAQDGAALAMLWLARKLILEQVEEEPPNAD